MQILDLRSAARREILLQKIMTKKQMKEEKKKKRLLAFMKTAASSVTPEDIVKQYKTPSTHLYSSSTPVDRTLL
ncbi:unnamed protein product [Linum trigynum]|uniref:Uncharacterized protein n=1 Tax=Linum trigynum TaxID=586398 RepID=A0AAV2FWX3_9ROSI